MDDAAAGPRGRLAALLRAHRTAAELTQRQLAGRAGVSLGALEDLEQGRTRRPRREALSRLAGALRLGPAELEELTRAAGGRPPAGARRGQPGLRVDTGLPRAVVVDALWGHAPPPSAIAMIQAQASQVRRLLGDGRSPGAGPRLSWDGASYRLSPAGIGLDVAEFGELAGRGERRPAATPPARVSCTSGRSACGAGSRLKTLTCFTNIPRSLNSHVAGRPW